MPTPTAGDMERGGTFGGGPGSAPGERRCEDRERFIPVPRFLGSSAAVLIFPVFFLSCCLIQSNQIIRTVRGFES